jgi:hypothetical protein
MTARLRRRIASIPRSMLSGFLARARNVRFRSASRLVGLAAKWPREAVVEQNRSLPALNALARSSEFVGVGGRIQIGRASSTMRANNHSTGVPEVCRTSASSTQN